MQDAFLHFVEIAKEYMWSQDNITKMQFVFCWNYTKNQNVLAKKIEVCYNRRNEQLFYPAMQCLMGNAVEGGIIMKITITAKKMQIPQNFTEYAENRLNSKLDKFFGEEAEAKITMANHKNLMVIELTVTYNNMIYRAEQSAVDKEDALDASVDKIIRQIRKNKTRVEKKLKEAAFVDMLEEPVAEAEHEVVRHKKFVMHAMDLDEAILQMDLLGHAFFMFTNANTGEVNVVYKRSDGKYAVLEPIYE